MASNEGQQKDTLPSQLYGWKNNAPKRVSVTDDGSLNIAGSLIPTDYDYMALTYVSVGNGVGKVETVTYKTGGSGGITTAVLTLTYNSDNKVETVART